MVLPLSLLLVMTACRGAVNPGEPQVPRRERGVKAMAPPPPSASLDVLVRAAGALAPGLKSAGPCGVGPPKLGADGALADVAVWVNQVAEAPIPSAGAFALGGCALTPPLLMLTPGSAVSVTSPLSNAGKPAREIRVFAAGSAVGAPAFANRTVPPGGVVGLPVPQDGIATVSCTGEPCEGEVVVGAAGGLSDLTGHVKVQGVKPGDVTVYAYHPALGRVQGTVNIGVGASAELTLTLPAPASPQSP